MKETISIIELKNLLKQQNIKLIDIRPNYQYNRGTIPTAINIPYQTLMLFKEKYLLKEEEYYLFCDSGKYSYEAVRKLRPLGYQVFSIEEGYDGFLK